MGEDCWSEEIGRLVFSSLSEACSFPVSYHLGLLPVVRLHVNVELCLTSEMFLMSDLPDL